jgi:tetratricopeptide (TPR) repeat protein
MAEVLEEREDFRGALAEVERVRAIQTHRALDFHTAGLRLRAGDFEGGLALLESMREAAPEDDEVLYQIALLHGLAKRQDKALELMQKVLELNPENPHALNYIGYTWAERGERLDEAEQMLLRALELRPDDGYITDSLAWVYYMRARPLLGSGKTQDGRALLEQARAKLDRAAQLTGGDPVVSEHLGDVYLLLEDKRRALEYYQEAISLKPREDEQPNLVQKLEDLRRELEGK